MVKAEEDCGGWAEGHQLTGCRYKYHRTVTDWIIYCYYVIVALLPRNPQLLECHVTCTGHTHSCLLWQSNKPFNVLSFRGFTETRPTSTHTKQGPIWPAEVFFLPPFPYPRCSWNDFFFFAIHVKSPKRVSLEHGFIEEANRLIPLGHELIKSKTWGQIRPCSRSRDECSLTVHSDKMIKIKKALNKQLWRQKEDNGQREKRKTHSLSLRGGPGRLLLRHKVYFLSWALIHLAVTPRRVSSIYCLKIYHLQ